MPGAARWRWSLAASLLVLAGLLGMHGLGDHGAMSGLSGMRDMPMAGAMPAPAYAAGSPDRIRPISTPNPAHLDDGGDSGEMAMGLCLAVLLGGVLAWRVLGAARRRSPWALPRAVLVPVVLARSRPPDPPSPHRLCVWRC